ncbi:MAG TPA: glutaredoxin 3 [Ramlibacter sp.]|nr:glutaredoxin 3 [Ramlibacter sp.]
MKVVMYTTGRCPYCTLAEGILKKHGVTSIEKKRVDLYAEDREEMVNRSGRRSVPQIFIGDAHIGGSDELEQLDRSGALGAMLAGTAS